MEQNNILYQEKLIEGVITQLIESKSKGDVRKWIKSKSIDSISESEISEIIELAFKKLRKMAEDGYAELINTHAAYYNKIIDYFKKIGYTAGLNKAMKAKENLFRIGKTNNVNITSSSITTINTSPEPKYDLNKLTPEERERFEFYKSISKK